MSRQSRCRKTVNYSDFMDDEDEDFTTVRATPNKKPRPSVKELQQEISIKTDMETHNSAKEIINLISEECTKRVSMDEKLYKRDLKAALSLSLSTDTVEQRTTTLVEEDQPPVLTHCNVGSSVCPPQDVPPVLSNCSEDFSHIESDGDFNESEGEDYTIKKKVERKKTRKEKKTMQNSVTKGNTPKLPQGKPQSTGSKKVLSQSPGVADPVLKRTPITPPTPKLALCSSPPGGRLPKWNPPGLVGSSPTSQSVQVKSPGLGLRIGLSRLARIKPLHPNSAAH